MQAPRAVRTIISQQVRRASGYHHAGPTTTYNDLPSPAGSWKTHYEANQRKYNGHLLLGVGFFTGTIIFGKATGMFEFYNDYPEKPATITNYKESD